MSFHYLLGHLPANKDMLSSDACGSHGMAGVLRFVYPHKDYPGYDGLFWQCQ